MTEDNLKWARDLVDEHAWVFVAGANVVGRVTDLFDSQGRKYVSPVNDGEVTAPVIVVEPGHSFVAVADNFVRLEEKEAQLYIAIQEALKMVVTETVKLGVSTKQRPRSVAMLLGAAMRAQAALLEVQPKEPPNDGPESKPPAP